MQIRSILSFHCVLPRGFEDHVDFTVKSFDRCEAMEALASKKKSSEFWQSWVVEQGAEFVKSAKRKFSPDELEKQFSQVSELE
eukprot:7572215-Alexandrium_andersonii.AAC.1